MNTIITLPLSVLPEAKEWPIGGTYRVKLVLKQTALSETSATFEVIDANSLEPEDKGKQSFLNSDSGMYIGKK